MCRGALLRRPQMRAMVRDGVEDSADVLGQCRYCGVADHGIELLQFKSCWMDRQRAKEGPTLVLADCFGVSCSPIIFQHSPSFLTSS